MLLSIDVNAYPVAISQKVTKDLTVSFNSPSQGFNNIRGGANRRVIHCVLRGEGENMPVNNGESYI